jgi:hypothetical protein
VRITAQLIYAPTDRHLWAESYERELKDVLTLQDDVARAIANEINVTLTPQEQKSLSAVRSVNPEAFEAYLKGRYYWNKRTAEGIKKALDYFQQAINQQPDYGLAYSGLADCSSGLTWHGFASPKEALPERKQQHSRPLRSILHPARLMPPWPWCFHIKGTGRRQKTSLSGRCN